MNGRSRLKRPVVGDDEGPPEPKPLVPGVASALSPLVRRVLAPNPGLMTGPGTNTYLVGIDEVAVIDPGPDDAGHRDAIIGAGGDRIRWIVCTHTHIDHAPGAPKLAKQTGAEILAYDSRDGLKVQRELRDGDRIEGTEFRLTAVHTPGHASNHLCFLLEEERTLFSGDHVMQGSTVVISPPDGDMAAYLASLERLRSKRPALRAIAPGHGHVIEDPAAVLDEYLEHRREREGQVVDALAALDGTATPAEIVERVYVDLVDGLKPWAQRTVHAHLRKLHDEGRVETKDPDDATATWALLE
ncbi:MAG: MBL fold metallo-hydrolase [Acidimicrobiales bacterium]